MKSLPLCLVCGALLLLPACVAAPSAAVPVSPTAPSAEEGSIRIHRMAGMPAELCLPPALSQRMLAELTDARKHLPPPPATAMRPLFCATAGGWELVWFPTHVICTSKRTDTLLTSHCPLFDEHWQQALSDGRVEAHILDLHPSPRSQEACAQVLREAFRFMAGDVAPSPASPSKDELKAIYLQKTRGRANGDDLVVSYSHERQLEPVYDSEGKLRFVETKRPVGGAEVHNISKKQKHGGILHVYFDLETGEVLLASFSK